MWMKGSAFFCGKQLCLCHLCFDRAPVTLFVPQHPRLLSALLWDRHRWGAAAAASPEGEETQTSLPILLLLMERAVSSQIDTPEGFPMSVIS